MNIYLIFLSLLTSAFFFNRGFAYYDEGFILHAAQRVLQGEVPYRDFDLIYTPGSVYLTAAAFKLLGESILTGRILMLLVSWLTGYLVYLICVKATKKKKGGFFFGFFIFFAGGKKAIPFSPEKIF